MKDIIKLWDEIFPKIDEKIDEKIYKTIKNNIIIEDYDVGTNSYIVKKGKIFSIGILTFHIGFIDSNGFLYTKYYERNEYIYISNHFVIPGSKLHNFLLREKKNQKSKK